MAADTATRVWRYPRDEWTAHFLGWEHLLPADHDGDVVRTELGEAAAADLGLAPGARVSAVAIRAESLRARLCDAGVPGALEVRRVLGSPGADARSPTGRASMFR